MLLKVGSILLGLVMLSWLVLLFSSRAMLVGERVEKSTLHETLVCTYFTGSKTLRKQYWYSQSDTFGRAACPRWERVRLADE